MKTGGIPTVHKLRKYNSVCWKHINKYLEEYLKKEDEELLHRARVEIKKLSALFHLLEFGNKTFNSEKELEQVGKIFKLSGKLRDYNNASKFSSDYKIKNTGLKAEGKKQPHIRKKLKNKLKKYRHRFNMPETKAAALIEKMEAPKYISLFLIKTKKEIIRNAVPNITAHSLHEIRKKIKELLFLDEYDTV